MEKTKCILPENTKYMLPVKDKVHFTWKRQSTFYREKTKYILPGKDKVHFYREKTKYILPGKDKVHFTWKRQSTFYLEKTKYILPGQVLLGQGSEYRVEDREKWTALHCAAKGGHQYILMRLR
jgi:hypothetical protein